MCNELIEEEDILSGRNCSECGNETIIEYLGSCHGMVARQEVCPHCSIIIGYI